MLTPGAKRFLRYALVGGSTFAFDLLLLYIATVLFGVDYRIATPIAFLIAVSLNYFLSRTHVFKGTERSLHHGYLYFLGFAFLGSLAVTAGVTLLVAVIPFFDQITRVIIARVLVAIVVGTGNYLLNLHFNFKVAGRHQ